MKTKRCAGCGDPKPLDEFRPNKSKRDGYQSYCIPCDKERQKAHYQKNKQKYIDKAKELARQKAEWWREYKKTLKCNRCPENHPACLQFHHSDPTQKEVTVSQVVRWWSIRRIMEEVAKCEVLCANCHAKEHWRDD
jgi:hypothetical protein